MSTSFEDWHAINSLMVHYTLCVDSARFEDLAALFSHARYRVEHADTGEVSDYYGSEPVLGFCRSVKIHGDGTPRTRHLVTNVDIQVDGDAATSRSYVTVMQQTETLPLQAIACGRYLDRFDRVDGRWRFAERLITGFLLGDRSEHVTWHGSVPE